VSHLCWNFWWIKRSSITSIDIIEDSEDENMFLENIKKVSLETTEASDFFEVTRCNRGNDICFTGFMDKTGCSFPGCTLEDAPNGGPHNSDHVSRKLFIKGCI